MLSVTVLENWTKGFSLLDSNFLLTYGAEHATTILEWEFATMQRKRRLETTIQPPSSPFDVNVIFAMDEQNTRYVVTSGARQKDEEWDPEENGGFAVHDTEGNAGPSDPLAALEKSTDAQNHQTKVQIPRLESLMDVSDRHNSDPYSLSLKARKHFREEKKIRKEQERTDTQVKDKYALPSTLKLAEENEDDIQDAKEQWRKGREEILNRERKRRKLVSTVPVPGTSKVAVVESLRARILGSRGRRFQTSSSTSRLHNI
ncbi:hypothetical protein D9757_001391 [Collybiopsis confluens]|uniref:Uncharacterized protein n=1 Tax=Collybiopsis confluens TaxID=2823264 RepID=A0A8H5HZD4_9AGAR|nr:hypothetical protein D9757_001391 [Collybiopsis confluens]